jgi:hypothetical protein
MKPRLSEAAVAKIMEHLLERFGEPIGDAQGDHQAPPSKGGKKKDMGNRGWGAKFEAAMPAACDQCGGMMGLDQCCTNCGMMPTAMEPPAGPPKAAGAPAAPAGTAVVVVKSTAGATAGGGGKIAQGLKVKDMEGIPASGSGRGTQGAAASSAPQPNAPPSKPMGGPTPMPAEMDEDEMDEEAAPPAPTSGSTTSAPSPSSGGGSTSSTPPSMDEELDEDDLGNEDECVGMDEEMDLDEKAPPGREKQVRALKKKKGINPFAVAWASYNKSHGDE